MTASTLGLWPVTRATRLDFSPVRDSWDYQERAGGVLAPLSPVGTAALPEHHSRILQRQDFPAAQQTDVEEGGPCGFKKPQK